MNEVGDSRIPDHFGLIAGSGRWLVYRESQGALRASTLPPDHRRYVALTRTLSARSVDGTTTTLPSGGPGLGGWSIVGSTLTASTHTYLPSPHIVAWWDLDRGTHGTLAVPANDIYVSAAPHAALMVTEAGMLEKLPIGGGTPTQLGFVPGSTLTAAFGLASDAGFSVETRGEQPIRYQAWSQPGQFVELQSDVVHRNGTGPPGCDSMTDTYIACSVEIFSRDMSRAATRLIPVDGGAPLDIDEPGAYLAITGSHVVYSTRYLQYGPRDVASMGIGDTAPSHVPGPFLRSLSAYGKVVTYNGFRRSQLVTYDGTLHKEPLITAALSPVQVAAFSLQPHRIAWIDDAKDSTPTLSASQAHQSTSPAARIESRRLHVADQRLFLGTSRTVAPLVTGVPLRRPDLLIATDGTTTTYQDDHDVKATSVAGEVDVADRSGQLRVADHRWVVSRNGPNQYDVFDLRSNAHRVMNLSSRPQLALSGDQLAVLTARGSVSVTDLVTGRRVVVHNQRSHYRVIGGSVAIHGSWVAWQWQTALGAKIRNFRTMAPAVALPDAPIGINGQGVVMAQWRAVRAYRLEAKPVTTAIFLRPLHGKTRRLFPPERFEQLPQIAGHVMAWIDGSGQLRAAPLH